MQILPQKLLELYQIRIPLILFIFALVSCGPQSTPSDNSSIQQLSNYRTIVSFEDKVLADPKIISFNSTSGHLLVYDAQLESVMSLSTDGTISQTFGRKGKGPGEYQTVSDIYALKDHIYIVDNRQYSILRYNRDGTLNATMKYGQYGTHRMNNPTVLGKDQILIPTATTDNTIYTLRNWNGTKIADIGSVPSTSTNQLKYDHYRTAVSNKNLPSYFKTHSFAVASGKSNGLFLIYEAYPKVHKYQTSGTLQWQTKRINTAEIDSLRRAYYNFMEMVLKRADAIRPLQKYVDGQTRSNNLFLSTNTDYDQPLWIHHFNGNGKLKRRYTLQAKVGLSSNFALNDEDKQFYVLTNKGDIRAYNFEVD